MGAKLVFLPAYSRDLSPIELFWSKFKEFLRSREPRTQEELDCTITEAILQSKRYANAQITEDMVYSFEKRCNIHSFYTRVERILELIGRKVDHCQPTGEQWHRQLLEQMCINIPEIRPAVISESTRTKLDEFRRFRHVVRSIYAYRLEGNRVIKLANRLQYLLQEFESEIQKFLTFID